jgi:hypothetical protein
MVFDIGVGCPVFLDANLLPLGASFQVTVFAGAPFAANSFLGYIAHF